MTEAQLKWLFLEGALPLFGAGMLYLCWGVMLRIAKGIKAKPYAWREAIDSTGWIYGALTIAIQSAIKSFSAVPQATALGYGCIMGAIVCALLLLAAMEERGTNPAWRPPMRLTIVTIILLGLILYAGVSAQNLSTPISPTSSPAGEKNERHAT